jgi:hypothetical protein
MENEVVGRPAVVEFTTGEATYVVGGLSPSRSLSASRVLAVRMTDTASFWLHRAKTVGYIFATESGEGRLYRIYRPPWAMEKSAVGPVESTAAAIRQAIDLHCPMTLGITVSIEWV